MVAKQHKTKAQQAVIEALGQLPHATPLEIFDWLKRHRSDRPGLTSVYRAINHLVHQGVVRRLSFDEHSAYYELVQPVHHHHAVCRRCKRISEVQFCPLAASQPYLAGFKILQHRFEIFGICIECARRTVDRK